MLDNITIGTKIKNLRKGRKITQHQLADILNVNRSSISNWEIDRRVPSLKELERIAKYFGVGLDYFGVQTTDDLFDIVARAKEIFNNDNISIEVKEELYLEMMKLYMALKENN